MAWWNMKRSSLSLEDLRALPKQTQITKHNCIQGWSGVAEWGGVCLGEVLVHVLIHTGLLPQFPGGALP